MIKVMKFYADWCGPCKLLKNVFNGLKQQYTDVDFNDINIEENRELVSQYSVMSVPTVIIFKDDVEVFRKVGFAPASAYEPFLK